MGRLLFLTIFPYIHALMAFILVKYLLKTKFKRVHKSVSHKKQKGGHDDCGGGRGGGKVIAINK